ncbi:GAF and ANTAR domain-containing protein [Amycolatopsis dendrobii]|uniref:GAF and ANTAR domain-containing protein n=1 Tax=Amycolatopsis dendrobii TaxID=2760662 RepID=A0A7W3W4G8_9PSEU|nr:GAF and ANTAR domain-containing protein [Amycolatopsis dendrobii]MBB1158197.1 GAF and ANTAR domain-containing protein [Amycolatopsis dendrobii]
MSDGFAGAVRSSNENELLRAFVDMADTLVDEYDVADMLHRLAKYCVTLLGASAAGLLLADQRGGLEVVASSDEGTRMLELLQLQTEQGPCLDAYRSGESVNIEDIAADSGQWPLFARQAAAAGFRSVQALPLRLRRQVIGTLNLFGRQGQSPVGGSALSVARALADIATIGILQERAIRRGELLTEQLQHALNSRVVIEQAKGVLAHAGGLEMDVAFERLRAYSRAHNARLSEVAEAVVRSALSPEQVIGGAS